METESEVPLDRDEELGRASAPPRPVARDGAVDLLFRTRIRDLNPRPAVTVGLGTSVAEACAQMTAHRIGCVLVMEGSRLAGIFTERDVLYRVTGADRRPSEIRIEEVMTPRPTTLSPGHRLAHALNKMSADGCRHIPIIDDAGQPLGVVSVRRITDFLVDHFAGQLLTLPPDPDQEMSRREGG